MARFTTDLLSLAFAGMLAAAIGERIHAGDCNGNGVDDSADISSGASADCNENAIPDDCEKPPLTFSSRMLLPIDGDPRAVAAADLNGDGRLDLTAALYTKAGISVLLNDGDGGFEPATGFGVGKKLQTITAADLDGDGDLDLAATSLSTNDVSVLRNQGDGSFGAVMSFTAGDRPPRSLAAEDLDGDGDTDLATANRTSDDVSILINEGGGTFLPPARHAAGSGPMSIAAGDFNGDRLPDLATANSVSGDVAILLNEGGASFGLPVLIPTGKGASSIAAADFDRDGDLDLVTANTSAKSYTVLVNEGAGGFLDVTAILSTSRLDAVTTLDADSDGAADLAFTIRSPSGSLLLVRNDGRGKFLPASHVPAVPTPSSPAVGDFDGDGELELAFASETDGTVSVLARIETGPSGFKTSSLEIGAQPHCMTTGDLDGDGDPDVVTGNGGSGSVSVLLNRGDEIFERGQGLGSVLPYVLLLVAGDLDEDGDLDLVACGHGGWRALLNKGDATFSMPHPPRAGDSFSIELADFDGDGDLDLVTGSTPFSIHLNEGKGSFARPITVPVPSSVSSLAALDVEGDGDMDLGAAHVDAGFLSILRNEGGAGFSKAERVAIRGQPQVILSGHFNDDRHMDLVAADWFVGKLHLLVNDGSGGFVPESRGGVDGFTSSVTSLASGDLDSDGDLDLAATYGHENSRSLSVILNNGDDTFAEPFDVEVEAGPRAVRAADLDGDGDLDLISGNRLASSITVALNQIPPSPAYLERVCTEAEFHSVSARARQEGEAERIGKYLAPARVAPSLLPALFQNVKRFPLHEQFLAEVFPDRFPGLAPEEYLALTARRETRSYFAGELSLLRTRPAQGGGGDGVNAEETIYGFNVFADETRRAELLTVEETRRLHQTLAASFHLRPLAYAPGSPAAVEAAEKWERPGFPIHFARDSGAAYQPYTRGTNYGRVRVLDPPAFEEANENGRFGWQDILVLGLAPSDIEGVVAGVITAEPQGELSHLTIRTARRGTPNAFVKGALEAFAALDGKLVRLEVKEAEYVVRDAEPEEAEAWWAANRPRLSAVPALDPEHAELDTLVEIDLSPAPLGPQARFGGKASNFARLQRILDGGFERYREAGFAIPMRHYLEFMRSNVIASSLDPAREVTYEGYLLELFASPRFQSDSGFRFEALEELRDHAEAEGIVDPELLGRLASRVEEVFGDAAGMVRFRSSSNVEDSLEFNGAGLYESASACAADDLDQDRRGPSRCDPRKAKERSIEEALKEVWASLWSFRAHEERAYYQIPQASAAMGVLVTRAFLDERANGVAFTGNPSNPRDRRYIVTVQVGEASVVSPEPGVSAEVDALLVEGGVVRRIDRVRRSSLVESDAPILSDAELGELGALLGYIDSRFPIDLGPHRRDQVFLDFEFKVNPDGALALKQVRPFLASEPEPPGPTFELEIAPGTAACGVFVSGREPGLEYDLKSQVRFRAGRIPLPTRGATFEAQLFDEVLVGPAAQVAVPKGPGVFSVKKLPAGGGRATYRFEHKQELILPDGWEFELKLLRLDFEARDGEAIEPLRVLDEELVARDMALETTALSARGHGVHYGPCSHHDLPLWVVNAELEGGASLRLEERVLPSLTSTGPGSLVRADVLLGGKSQVVTDYWSLVYTAFRHNRLERFWVILPQAVPVPGVDRLVHAVELREPDPLRHTPAGASYLDADLVVVARPAVLAYEKSPLEEPSMARFRRGDIDGNGALDVSDAISILRYIFQSGARPACEKAADANDDGRLNVTDAIRMLLHFFRGHGPLPPPFEACGSDPTEDSLRCEGMASC